MKIRDDLIYNDSVVMKGCVCVCVLHFPSTKNCFVLKPLLK